jgi:hypothetical protein
VRLVFGVFGPRLLRHTALLWPSTWLSLATLLIFGRSARPGLRSLLRDLLAITGKAHRRAAKKDGLGDLLEPRERLRGNRHVHVPLEDRDATDGATRDP